MIYPLVLPHETITALAAKRPCVLFNGTDGLQAVPGRFRSVPKAQAAADAFRARFAHQGYYKTADGDRIPVEAVELVLIPATRMPMGAAWPGRA